MAEAVLLAELSSAVRARQQSSKALVKRFVQIMVDLQPSPQADNDAQHRIETQIAELKDRNQSNPRHVDKTYSWNIVTEYCEIPQLAEPGHPHQRRQARQARPRQRKRKSPDNGRQPTPRFC